MALLLVTVWIWRALWNTPPGDVDARVLLTPPTLGLILIGTGLWMLVTGKHPEKGSPRYPYAFRGAPKKSDGLGSS